jgi:general secretion pathway protein G
MKRVFENRSGVTLVELVVTLTILSLLAAMIVPSARMTAKRTRELELRRNLRVMRIAIDDYKKKFDEVKEKSKNLPGKFGESDSGYPKDLKTLVEGYDFGEAAGKADKKKFLRRIPVDPFNVPMAGEEPKWGLRSYKDEPDSTTWGGDDVFDVFSLSNETAIDGSKYKDW